MSITANGDDTTVEIEGAVNELLDFAELVENCSVQQPVSLRLAAAESMQGSSLEAVSIQFGMGLMSVSVSEKALLIVGSKEACALLAQNIRQVAETEYPLYPGEIQPHSHIEYYPGHFFLKPDAVPLILSLRKG